jgi:hypothetical protein
MKFHFKREVRSKEQEARSLAAGHPYSVLHAPSSFLLQPSQKGVALIITVILLSLLTLMALAFLTMSQRERGAVTTTTDTASARLAADAALASAEAQIVANVLATTNPYNFGLLVSTNYINLEGYIPALEASPTNVNYYDSGGIFLSGNNFLQNLANLYYSPRPPVFIQTNGALDFRFYLDLNRNGRFDTNGIVGEFDNNNNFLGTNFEVGDPEWIGVLQRPDQPYGPNNPFVARFAFIAVPIGNALDLNTIHDQTLNLLLNSTKDGYFRNQGVGSWEINLAAFLADLNTNQWDGTLGGPYKYLQPAGNNNSGAAFNDAFSILSYRYDYNYTNLATVDNLFGGPPNGAGYIAFRNDNIDGYSDGPLQTGFSLPGDIIGNDNSSLPWAGADNTNHFFTHQELFDPNKTSGGPLPAQVGFTNRLLNAGNGASTYDRYTFYRLLSQLGTDSAPEQNKMNINYRNVTNGVVVPNLETNFYPWTAIEFFTNAADRMLRAYTTQWRNSNPTNFATTFYTVTNFNFVTSDQWTNYPAFGITNIPVLVSNQFVYTPAVQRVLQLAANIYDATTNRYYDNSLPLTPLPTVFKPVFSKVPDGTSFDVYISGFTEVTDTSFLTNTLHTLNGDPQVVAALQPNDLIFGVPLIIGAKKGFPNFNEFAMENAFQLTRKLLATRSSTNVTLSTVFKYYEMFNLSITNQLGVECWNSYTNNFIRPVDIYATNYLFMTLTNDENFITNANYIISGYLPITSTSNNNNGWPGYNPNGNAAAVLLTPASFQIPLNVTVPFVPDATYRFNNGSPYPYLAIPPQLDYETNVTGFPQPHWWLTVTNNLQVFMVDEISGRIIDYVQLRGPNSIRDLTAEILNPITGYDTVGSGNDTGYNDLWDTNVINGFPAGINDQLNVSQGSGIPTYVAGKWSQDEKSAYDQMNGFLVFLNGANTPLLAPTDLPDYKPDPTQMGIAATTNAMQVPYTPTATVVQHISWQANDPLVHYIASDLNWSGAIQNNIVVDSLTNENLGKLNKRYMPWGGNAADPNPWDPALKDPLVWQSDDWDFPTYKFPTVGWLGRVHRGTPWQTVYLKSPDILKEIQIIGNTTNYIGTNTWMTRTGNGNTNDAVNTAPVQDRLLFDLFTTAFNDNATRGQLSVNVEAGLTNNPLAGLAAWSALFSGVVVPTNTVGGYTNVQPAGPGEASSLLGELVTNINDTRVIFTNTDGLVGTFEHAGDILAAPELTVSNQWILLNNNNISGISDEMYEWLPQQVMSLLRCSSSPRYVIYCYGQALKPAQNSLVTSGSFFGMVTNYQVVAEAATRAVVRFNSTLTNVVTTNNTNAGIWFAAPVVTNNNVVIERFNVLPPD